MSIDARQERNAVGCRGIPETVVRASGDLARAIRETRKRQGLTQEEAALAADLNRSYLSALEGGHETEFLQRLLRVIQLLGLELVVRSRDIRRGG